MTDFNLVLSQVRQRLEILYQIVDELEAQGGGGGQGGTDNYNELSNKPKINNITLSGNKTGEDLGLADYAALADKADKSTTYTKTQVDGLLDNKADKSTTYTKTEVDTALSAKADAATTYTKTETDAEIASEITGAINDLDVSAVGGSTKYLTTISEANGLINATAATPDTVPTTSSTKLITSGGVKTYVDDAKTEAKAYTDTQVADKITMTNILGAGQRITATSEAPLNFNDAPFTSVGRFNWLSDSTPNITNCPSYINGEKKGGILETSYIQGGTTILQTVRPSAGADSPTIFWQRFRYGSPGTWTPWYAFTGTQVQAANAQTTNLGGEMRRVASLEESDIEPIEEPQEER